MVLPSDGSVLGGRDELDSLTDVAITLMHAAFDWKLIKLTPMVLAFPTGGFA